MDIKALHKKVENELKQVDSQLELLESEFYTGSMAIRGGWEFYYVLRLAEGMDNVEIIKTIFNLVNMLEYTVSADMALFTDESDRIIVVQVQRNKPKVKIHIPKLK